MFSRVSISARAALAAVALATTNLSAAADELFFAVPSGAVVKSDPRGGNFQMLGVCTAGIQSFALDGSIVFIGDANGGVYRFDQAQGQVVGQFQIPSPARSMLVRGSELLIGTTDSVLRVNKTTGALNATLPISFSADALHLRGDDLFVGSSFAAVFKGSATTGNFNFWGTCTGPIASLAGDGTHLWAGSNNGFVLRFEAATGAFVGWFAVDNDAVGLALHQGDLLVAGSDGSVERRQRITGEQRDELTAFFPIAAIAVAEAPEPGTPYCYATSNCPCGNNDPQGGCANSTQVGTLLSGSGTASVVADDLVLHATQMPNNKAARFYMSLNSTQNPFGDGFLCAGSGGYPIQRFPPSSSDAQGRNLLGPGIVGFSHANFAANAHIQPGWSWHFQIWHRDPSGPCGGTVNTSNAYVVQFVP